MTAKSLIVAVVFLFTAAGARAECFFACFLGDEIECIGCKANAERERWLDVCRRESWDTCDRLGLSDPSDANYSWITHTACEDRYRKACLARNGRRVE